MKNIIYVAIVLGLMMSCTGDFKELNKDPYEITDESLKQDFKHVGAFFPSLLGNIYRPGGSHQVECQFG